MKIALGQDVRLDYPLLTLREIEVFFKDTGKTSKLNKRTEQLLNENFHDNISCLNEEEFFLCPCHLWSKLQKRKPQTKLCSNEVFCSC